MGWHFVCLTSEKIFKQFLITNCSCFAIFFNKLENESKDFLSSIVLEAHYQVPPFGQSQQETGQCAQEHGEVPIVPDTGWHSLSSCQLGSAQRSGEFLDCSCFCCCVVSLLTLGIFRASSLYTNDVDYDFHKVYIRNQSWI